MVDSIHDRDAVRLARDGWSDEDVERLTGLSLLEIVGVRARAASEPARSSPGIRHGPRTTVQPNTLAPAL